MHHATEQNSKSQAETQANVWEAIPKVLKIYQKYVKNSENIVVSESESPQLSSFFLVFHGL